VTAAQLFENLDRRGFFHIRPGLDAVQTVLTNLGHPERRFAAIHIAGTNGKGSTGAMLERILREAGYRTGLYSSPHLIRIHERIRIGGVAISDTAWIRLGKQVLAAEKHTQLKLTYFEFVTVVAFLYFAEQRVEVAVVECGLGGLWDATNVLPKPVVGIVTSIGLDHTAWLGKTEAKIAVEKAGIIKNGMMVISGVRGPGQAVIHLAAKHKNASIYQLDSDFQGVSVSQKWPILQHSILYKGPQGAHWTGSTRLMGNYQADNTAIVLQTIACLRQAAWPISEQAVRNGLKKVQWPGRLQLIQKPGRARILIDGAHNPPAIQKLVRIASEKEFKNISKSFVFSAFKDKDIASMAKLVDSIGGTVFVSSMGGDRSPSLGEIKAFFRHAIPCSNPMDALEQAITHTPHNGIIFVAGSLMQAGMILEYLKQDV